MAKQILIAYFSHKGMNFSGGKIEELRIGNTARAASMIAEIARADLYEIEAAEEYPYDYRACVERAKKEFADQSRPPLVSVLDTSVYDLFIVGWPNWCGTTPMPVRTFLDGAALNGKVVLPFCTHEGSGFGNALQDLRQAYPAVLFGEGLAIRGSQVLQSKAEIQRWLRHNNCVAE